MADSARCSWRMMVRLACVTVLLVQRLRRPASSNSTLPGFTQVSRCLTPGTMAATAGAGRAWVDYDQPITKPHSLRSGTSTVRCSPALQRTIRVWLRVLTV